MGFHAAVHADGDEFLARCRQLFDAALSDDPTTLDDGDEVPGLFDLVEHVRRRDDRAALVDNAAGHLPNPRIPPGSSPIMGSSKTRRVGHRAGRPPRPSAGAFQ